MSTATSQIMVEDMTLEEFEERCDRIDALMAECREITHELLRRLEEATDEEVR